MKRRELSLQGEGPGEGGDGLTGSGPRLDDDVPSLVEGVADVGDDLYLRLPGLVGEVGSFRVHLGEHRGTGGFLDGFPRGDRTVERHTAFRTAFHIGEYHRSACRTETCAHS